MRTLPTIMRNSNSVRALCLGALILLGAASSATAGPAARTPPGAPPPATAGPGDIVLHARSATNKIGAWSFVNDATAADGVRLSNADAGQPKVANAAAAPASYFEMTFTPEAGRAY